VGELDATVAERCERSAGAAELRRQARGKQPLARVDEADEPAGGLQAERRRHRLLQQRARSHHGAAMGLREARARV
jgi:hypothetical protein